MIAPICHLGIENWIPNKIGKILSNVGEDEDTNALSSYITSLISSAEPEIPTPNNSYAYGPFLFTQKNPLKVDEYQKKVSDRLASRLKDKLRVLIAATVDFNLQIISF